MPLQDLSSPYLPDTALAINGVSHIASPSIARDLSPDLLSKLSHTSPHIRKKAVLVLYKCFLQSPELLRTSWPRLRECLNDEDGSVVSATVNVVCELARRNPRNYLPLAPQLFKLLTECGNNWMTIKLIKLVRWPLPPRLIPPALNNLQYWQFATLTPLEPRLIKKLIPPITNLIRTTPAMSLLYECINGLISGGLLAGIQETDEGEELASVCVTKLRGFLVEGDSNLKYVGLLALTKLVTTHSHLVGIHQDVILNCIDDTDISIRYRALELVVGMVNSESLPGVVGRLIRQLKPDSNPYKEELVELEIALDDSDDEDMEEEVMHPRRTKGETTVLELPEEYKRAVIKRIVEMCSRDMYANVGDFEWYLDVLVQLIRYAPLVPIPAPGIGEDEDEEESKEETDYRDVGEDIGQELRNVAVRVKSVRAEAARHAELLVARKEGMFPVAGGGGRRVLSAAGWIVGEYARSINTWLHSISDGRNVALTDTISLLVEPDETLSSLLHTSSTLLPADILAIYIQAIPKIYAVIAGSEDAWTPARKSILTLLTSKIIKFLEPLAISPNLEVQERAVEFLELFRLAGEAIAEQPALAVEVDEEYDAPLLITQAIPAMFLGTELNPVAPRAQRKVPLPPGLDLDEPINPNLHQLLVESEHDARFSDGGDEDDGFREWYYQKAIFKTANVPASFGIDSAAAKNLSATTSYQGGDMKEEDYLDRDILERRKRERRERNRDDPFYIGGVAGVDEEVDLDSIPVMKLDLGDLDLLSAAVPLNAAAPPRTKKKERVEIAADEGIGGDEEDYEGVEKSRRKGRKGKGLLQVDSSGLVGYSLEEPEGDERKQEEEDIKAARVEVDRLRAEMDKAAERVKARASAGEPKPKSKKKKKGAVTEGEVKKKKKKVKRIEQTEA